MLISFDPEAKALYIQIKDAKIKRTVEFGPETFVDLDSKGDLIGVEMLHPGKLTILRRIAREYQVPFLGRVPSEFIPRAFAHA
ncbi:MAG: hypothetical protein A2902_06525 [Elusimicrobia bacterium RIFCSPLOWO2_01_FULL_64_13]|nr:MAG: hypothetical protein A2636_01605 [Elusimicrobia bacterium RIFCSPHIGHO2_01_FULL_64_10]OGR96684.1 MAG: hypothetical protein A2902_06525 [Elusimicrobia bacterium RIFCSPLOWO2_01_FULL_64_13]